MKFTTKMSLIRSTCTIITAAVISAASLLSTPSVVSGIPITMQNFFAALSGLVLGGFQGAGAVGFFIVLGALEIPVFACHGAGLSTIVGKTGGYLWGYILGALIAGLIMGSPLNIKQKLTIKDYLKLSIAAFIAFATPYILGIPWYIHIMDLEGNQLDTARIIQHTISPFILGDFVKLTISIPLAAVLRPLTARILYQDDDKEAEEIYKNFENRRTKKLWEHIINKRK